MGVIFAFLILGVMGLALIMIVSAEQESRAAGISKDRAFYAVQAGIEYALSEILNGGYPVVQSKAVGDAVFSTSIDPAARRITAIGLSSSARNAHSAVADLLAADCTRLGTEGANLGGPGNSILENILINRHCLDAINVDKVTVSWAPNSGEKVVRIKIGNDNVYDSAVGTPSGAQIDITDYRTHSSVHIKDIEFSSGMAGRQIVVSVTYTDTSTITSDPMTF